MVVPDSEFCLFWRSASSVSLAPLRIPRSARSFALRSSLDCAMNASQPLSFSSGSHVWVEAGKPFHWTSHCFSLLPMSFLAMRSAIMSSTS